MKAKTELDNALTFAERIKDKKGENILVLDIQAKGAITDYLVLSSVESMAQTRAIADDLQIHARNKMKRSAVRVGQADSDWVILDMGTIVIHIMEKSLREYYDLEELWSQGGTTAYHI